MSQQLLRFFLEVAEAVAVLDFGDVRAVQLDDFEHVRLVGRVGGFLHTAGARVTIAGEWVHRFRELCALLVGVAGHDRGDGAGECAAFFGVVAEAVAHDERAEVGVAEAERAEVVRLLSHGLARELGHVDADLENERPDADRVAVGRHVKRVGLDVEER